VFCVVFCVCVVCVRERVWIHVYLRVEDEHKDAHSQKCSLEWHLHGKNTRSLNAHRVGKGVQKQQNDINCQT
jgi:hypothetical protein